MLITRVFATPDGRRVLELLPKRTKQSMEAAIGRTYHFFHTGNPMRSTEQTIFDAAKELAEGRGMPK